MENKNNSIKDKVKDAAERVKNKFQNETSDKESEEKKQKEEVKELTCEEKIKLLEKQIIELKTDKLRGLADFDNYRKRKEQEIIETRERTIINFITDILPSIDNFEMSLKMTDNTQMFIKGVEMIHKNLVDILEKNKIKPFSPKVGDEFNPHEHDPILIEDEKAKPGKIITIVKKGYKHKDKIIVPARVQVKKE